MAKRGGPAVKWAGWLIKNIEELVAGAALVVMVSVTTVNVLCRYLLRSPIRGAEEVAVICLVWSTFIGCAACYKNQSHLGMDFVIGHLPERGRRVAQQLLCVIQLVFFLFITAFAAQFALRAEKTTPYLHLSYFYLYISVVLGFFSMSVHALRFLVLSFRRPEDYDRIFVKKQGEEVEER